MTEPWQVDFYAKLDGTKPVQVFLDSLEGKQKREALTLISLIGERGNQLAGRQSKLVETGLFELKHHQVRIFYVFRPGRRVVLLDGIIKKQDEIPHEVLHRVRLYRKDVEARDL